MNNRLAVVWDWNGTLVDDSFVFVEIMNQYLSLSGLPKISLHDYRNHFCFPVIQYYKNLGFDLSTTEFKKLSYDFIKKYKKAMFKAKIKKNILSVLDYLKDNHCKQFILSAQEQNLLNLSVEYYQMGCVFDGVFGLDNNFAASKTILAHRCLNPLIKAKQNIVFIGDTVHDFEVASSVGASCCLVSWGHNSQKRLLDTNQVVVTNTSDLLSFLKTLL